MKKLLALVLCCALPAEAAIAYVTSSIKVTGCAGGGTTCVLTLGSTSTAGNAMSVGILIDSGCTISSVTDSGGSSYSQKATVTNASLGAIQRIYGALSISASTTVSVAFSGSCNSQYTMLSATEYSGVSLFGNTNTATGNSGTTSVSVTMQQASNFSQGSFGTYPAATWTATAGTIRTQASNATNGALASIDNSGSGSLAVTATLTSAQWLAVAVELCQSNPCASTGTGPVNSGMFDFWGAVPSRNDPLASLNLANWRPQGVYNGRVSF